MAVNADGIDPKPDGDCGVAERFQGFFDAR
jgi:hypothetical protein